MAEMAAADLGPERFREILGYIPGIKEATTDPVRVRTLSELRLPGLPKQQRRYSQLGRLARRSPGRRNGLPGRSTISWSDYTSKVERFLERKLTWDRDDLALQNIQARVRGPSVWMLANVKGALLLATSNRSEAAVGYATMDGDTCGGLSPIAGIDKAFLRHWLRWLEKEGPIGVRPVPALSVVNGLTPTAELRPLETTQTDEADLMPYEVLDPIERAAIRDKQTPIEIFRRMRAQFPQFSNEQRSTSGSIGSSGSGAATSGSANATPHPSTWTTRT